MSKSRKAGPKQRPKKQSKARKVAEEVEKLAVEVEEEAVKVEKAIKKEVKRVERAAGYERPRGPSKPHGRVPEAMVAARHGRGTISRPGRGFSFGELSGAGLAPRLAARWGVRIDSRRRTIIDGNLSSLKSWQSRGGVKARVEGGGKKVEEALEKAGGEVEKAAEFVEKEAAKAAKEVKKEAKKAERAVKRMKPKAKTKK